MDPESGRNLRFSKPKHLWHWLMLLTPAAIIIVGAALPMMSGSSREPQLKSILSGIFTGAIGVVLCLSFGFWLARESEGIGWKIFGAVLFGSALAALNLAIGFPGCMYICEEWSL